MKSVLRYGAVGACALVLAGCGLDTGSDGELASRGGELVIAYSSVLYPSDPMAGANAGFSVATDGDTAIVGALENRTSATGYGSGAAYVYRRSGSGWLQEGKLEKTLLFNRAWVGVSVDISGDTAAVGTGVDRA